jgi:hypothetical protein
MIPLVNEWQLQSQLNQALAQQHRADFALWLAMLSPAVEEMAEFTLANTTVSKAMPDLRQQFGISSRLEFSSQLADIGLMRQHHETFIEGGMTSLRLAELLQPPPLVICHDRKKLDAEVLDNLSIHAKRRLLALAVEKTETDPTLLYDILQNIA